MSEKTVIGGTVYETVGSSKSNLLLKCNGTARIQWGNKLIDLIKNGKIVSSNLEQIFIISDESEIKYEGVYILNNTEYLKLLIYKSGLKYDLTGTNLYISANTKLNITVELLKLALENIGMYYNTLEDVEKSGILNGIVYVISTKNLYTIKDGKIEEFEAKLKTISVEKENELGEVINSSFKIVLSVLDTEYLILSDLLITANYSINIKNSAQIGSEAADATKGYRLYMDGNTSCLDVDKINVRLGLPSLEYIETTYDNLIHLIKFKLLEPHRWYLITDFQNHWKLPVYNLKFNRPILIRALTKSTFYEEGLLFKDRRVVIHYDYTYGTHDEDIITQSVTDVHGATTYVEVKPRGLITWMRDSNNNEANFDFLDYTDANNKPLTTLHSSIEDKSLDKSIFPKYSHDNKLTVYDLKGTIIKKNDEGKYVINNDNVTEIDFQFDDSETNLKEECIEMYNNLIECRGLVLTPVCKKFYNNTVNKLCNVLFAADAYHNQIQFAYHINSKYNGQYLNIEDLFYDLNNNNNIFDLTVFDLVITNNYIEGFISSKINEVIDSNTFGVIRYSEINNIINNSIFGNVTRLVVNGIIKNSGFNNITWATINGEINNSSFNDFLGTKDYSVIIDGAINNCTFNDIFSTGQVTIKDTITINGTNVGGTITNCVFKDIKNSEITNTISDNIFNNIENSILKSSINTCTFANILNSQIEGEISNSTFEEIKESKLKILIQASIFAKICNSVLQGTFTKVKFNDLTNVTFNDDVILITLTCYSPISDFIFNLITKETEEKELIPGLFIPYTLYDSSTVKDVYYAIINDRKTIQVTITSLKMFFRGMIVMHAGTTPIPDGWAICDGGTYMYEGVQTTTPNLVGRFIKGTTNLDLDYEPIGKVDIHKNNEFKLEEKHLPLHSHPHKEHFHSLTNMPTETSSALVQLLYEDFYGETKTTTYIAEESSSGTEVVTEVGNYFTTRNSEEKSHTHLLTLPNETATAKSEESSRNWENVPFKIEPNYYALIFIMKL